MACGPKAVRSPDWILGDSPRYPASQYLVGVGTAPTSGGMADALQAAGSSARAELAQTIEVHVDHVSMLTEQSTSTAERRAGSRASMALEAERSDLSTFTRRRVAPVSPKEERDGVGIEEGPEAPADGEGRTP